MEADEVGKAKDPYGETPTKLELDEATPRVFS